MYVAIRSNTSAAVTQALVPIGSRRILDLPILEICCPVGKCHNNVEHYFNHGLKAKKQSEAHASVENFKI